MIKISKKRITQEWDKICRIQIKESKRRNVTEVRFISLTMTLKFITSKILSFSLISCRSSSDADKDQDQESSDKLSLFWQCRKFG